MKKLKIDSAATREIEEAVDYHEEQIAGLGEDLRSEVERALKRLLDAPQLCPPHRRTGFRKCFVARFRYTIFFAELEDVIWVAAMVHGSRQPGYWLGRSPYE